ncbi:MAG: 50S ribosomal protein L25/general stress protein Ctc [Gemmatimonadaceae bacterium]|nr:50S ribosomal protein L25/general stress protein Ctc [Gemmatimonadaceae bacterium]
MATARLSASPRTKSGKGTARKLRAAGEIPAVIYGHAREPQSLQLDAYALTRLLEKHSYTTTVIELDVAGTVARTIIRELQRHPVKRDVLHVDFQELVAGEKITVRVPIRFVGIPDGVKNGGGILDETVRELHISVDPSQIPNHLDVDVTALQVGKSLHVRDVPVPEGVHVLDDADGTICVCMVPKEVAEPTPGEAAAAATAPAEPELIRKSKAEDEEGAEGEGEKK